MKFKSVLRTLPLLSAMLLIGCSKSDTANPSNAKLIEPEQLISMQEASSITANTYTGKTTTNNAAVGQKLCGYDNVKNGLFQIGLIQKAFIPSSCGLQEPKEHYDFAKQNFSNTEIVPELGDEAFYCPSPRALHIMYLGYYINIMIVKEDKFISGDWEPNEAKVIYITAGKKVCNKLKEIVK